MTDIERDADRNSFHDVEISHALKGIADLRALSEEKGREEPTAEGIFTQALSEELQQVHQDSTANQAPEPTFAQRNRIITRRQSRRIVSFLVSRRSPFRRI